MSLIAAITVNKCDGCDRIAVCRTDIEYDTFESTWFDEVGVHFCPGCREADRHQPAIAEAHRKREIIRLAIVRETSENRRAEYVH